MTTINVAILGASGYTGAELIRILAGHPNVRIVDGCFESLPLEPHSLDYLYSVLAFHWTTDDAVKLEPSTSQTRCPSSAVPPAREP